MLRSCPKLGPVPGGTPGAYQPALFPPFHWCQWSGLLGLAPDIVEMAKTWLKHGLKPG